MNSDNILVLLFILFILYFFSNLDIIIILIIFFAFYKLLGTNESFTNSNNYVNYPLDAYPDDPTALTLGARKDPNFLVKLPYENLTTRHYMQMYLNKTTPKCTLDGTCDSTPGYFKNYFGYFENPKSLKSNYLGYDIAGVQYQDYKFDDDTPTCSSKKFTDLKNPLEPLEYPTWYDYENPPKYQYTGYPFYFGAKKMT